MSVAARNRMDSRALVRCVLAGERAGVEVGDGVFDHLEVAFQERADGVCLVVDPWPLPSEKFTRTFKERAGSRVIGRFRQGTVRDK